LHIGDAETRQEDVRPGLEVIAAADPMLGT